MTMMGRWHRFVERMNEREDAWMNRFFTPGTYRGTLCFLIFSCAATYFLWNIDAFFSAINEETFFGIGKKIFGGGHPIDPAEERWHRFWALIIGIPPIIASIVAMIMIPINRRRAREYDEDQQRQRDAQTWKPEDESDPPSETTPKPVWPEQDEQPAEDPVWNDEPQEPVGIQTPPKAEPPERFGNVRLEKSDGRATLVVPKKHS